MMPTDTDQTGGTAALRAQLLDGDRRLRDELLVAAHHLVVRNYVGLALCLREMTARARAQARVGEHVLTGGRDD